MNVGFEDEWWSPSQWNRLRAFVSFCQSRGNISLFLVCYSVRRLIVFYCRESLLVNLELIQENMTLSKFKEKIFEKDWIREMCILFGPEVPLTILLFFCVGGIGDRTPVTYPYKRNTTKFRGLWCLAIIFVFTYYFHVTCLLFHLCLKSLYFVLFQWGLLGRDPLDIYRLSAGLWYTERRDLLTSLYMLLRVLFPLSCMPCNNIFAFLNTITFGFAGCCSWSGSWGSWSWSCGWNSKLFRRSHWFWT